MSKEKKLEVVYRKTNDLIPYARNARTHDEAQINQIAGSIKEFGFNNPVLIDGENGIIAGHGRVLAAQKLELDTVPTIELSHLSEAQKKAYILADNRLAEKSGWDMEMLNVELEELKTDGIDIESIGFDDGIGTEVIAENSSDNKEYEEGTGEVDMSNFSDDSFAHECPRCKFRFND